MGSEWKEYGLTDLYSISSGLSKPAKDFGEGYPFLSFKDVFYNYFIPGDLTELVKSSDKERDRCSIQRGDVFLTRTSETMDELGMSCVARKSYQDATFNGFCKRLRPISDIPIHPEFVGYALRSPQFRNEMLAFSTMSTRASLNNGMISRLRINLPPISEQKAIAHILGSLDDKIELNRQMNETLEGMAQALFKSWFVDFDPVLDNAIRAGNTIPDEFAERAEVRRELLAQNQNSAKTDSPINNLSLSPYHSRFPSAFQFTEEIGRIPEGWESATLGDYLEIKRGGSPRPIHDFLRPNGLPWVKIADATSSSSRFLFETKDFIIPEGLKKTVLLKKGSLILSNSATPGLPIFLELDACIHDGWLHFPQKRYFGDLYLYQLFLIIREELVNQGNGSVFTNLKTDILRAQRIVVPPFKLLDLFESWMKLIFNKLLSLNVEIRTLSNLRDIFLPELISGELRIEDAEKIIKVGI